MSERRARPILFTGGNVRAIREDRKTQTRRTLKGFESRGVFSSMGWDPDDVSPARRYGAFFRDSIPDDPCPLFVPSPFGAPGDLLWVKETWAVGSGYDPDPVLGLRGCKPSELPSFLAVWYRAEPEGSWPFYRTRDGKLAQERPGKRTKRGQWRPSIFMPRWASREELTISRIWVERLNSISEADARAEGVQRVDFAASGGVGVGDYRHAYRGLWESINGPGSWALNPWVWCIEFSRRAAHG